MSTRTWYLAAAGLLLALLGVIATLQFRWVGEVSAAERERLQGSVRARGAELASAIDRDVTRTFVAFQVDPAAFERDAAGTLASAATAAAAETESGAAVKGIYLAEPGRDDRVQRLDVDARALSDAVWPTELSSVRDRVKALPGSAVPGLPLLPGFFNDPIDRDVPALIVPVTAPEPPLEASQGQLVVRTTPPQKPWHAVIIWLDENALRTRLVGPLVSQQFGAGDAAEFNVSVINRRTRQPIYQSGPPIDLAAADFTSDVFALRLNDLVWTRKVTPTGTGDQRETTPVKDQVAVTIVRRQTSPDEASPSHLVRQGATWTLAAQAKGGSLDALIARSRARNLVVSLGGTAVLGATVLLMAFVSARERRLARQQMEFVAAVSHELRTPLAVIRSAGENLADGVVSGAQIAQYGDLIRTEGRRLSDMVERVMDFAGMGSGTVVRSRRSIAVANLVRDAAAALAHEAAARHINVTVLDRDEAVVSGDADALATALRNVIGNAIKYSHEGGAVDVTVSAASDTVRISVCDRGIGIDRDDVPHVFDPFYRGRRAIDAQVRGSGIGLSVVRRIIEAHGGRVRLEAREGGGAQAVIDLHLAFHERPAV